MSTGTAQSILVTGGTGTLGRAAVRLLLEQQREVRVLSRRPRPAGQQSGPEWATGDLTTGEGIEAAVIGAGAIIHCATGRKDADSTRRLAEAARRTGEAPHLVYISIVGVDRVPFPYYRTKLETERIVEESGLPWTILRATQFHDLVARITAVQRWLPVTLTPAGMRFQPVEAEEVAERLVGLALGKPAGRVADMGGPQVWGSRELAQLTMRAYGRRRPVLPVHVPGKAGKGYREGGHLTPEHAVGRVTFAEYLAAAVGRKGRWMTGPTAPFSDGA